MKATGFIDLHCDTLVNFKGTKLPNLDTLNDESKHLSISKMPTGTKWAEFFAIFIPDDLRGRDAIDYFEDHCISFRRQIRKFSDKMDACRNFNDVASAFENGKFAAILTVEGGSVLAGDADRVKVIAEAGVKALTLVWNGENEIASGSSTENGFSEFGRKVIPLLEEHRIIIDVSHLNDVGFQELLTIAKRPFIASHSNARAVTSHKRNLTDAQIKKIVKREGLIGLNFCTAFLNDDSVVESLEVLYDHIKHFIELGAGKCLAMGSDFDGAPMPECLNSVEKVFSICDYMVSKGISEQVVDDIMFGNAYRFFEKNL